jgi:hypothetical protein
LILSASSNSKEDTLNLHQNAEHSQHELGWSDKMSVVLPLLTIMGTGKIGIYGFDGDSHVRFGT